MAAEGAGPLVGALALAAVYVLGPRLRPLGTKHPRRWLSVAAGASMAYVFLDVLPHDGEVDHALAREHGRAYDAGGRWVLAASVLAGWLAGATLRVPEVAISRCFAFVAGGVVMTSANEELPRDKDGRFGWFVLGAAVYGAVLLAV